MIPDFTTANEGDEGSIPGGTTAGSITLISEGNLEPRGGYRSSGDVKLIFDEAADEYIISFENLDSSGGPTVYVYLSQDTGISNSARLGELRSASGTLVYRIAASEFSPNFDTVLIWCDRINEPFGVAFLN